MVNGSRELPAPRPEHGALFPIGIYTVAALTFGVTLRPVYDAISLALGVFTVPLLAVMFVAGMIPAMWLWAKLGFR